jgi:Tfp pilus assembly protein PilO
VRINWRELKLTRESLGYGLFCLSGILLFLGAGIVPSQMRLNRERAEVAALEAKVREQRQLRPAYEELRRSAALALEMDETLSKAADLAPDAISTIPEVFGRLAREAGLEFASANPLRESLREDRSRLAVSVSCRGGWANFREFLVASARTPFVADVDRVEASLSGDGALDYVVRMRVRIQ